VADYFVDGDNDEVIENKLGITDPLALVEAEQDIVTKKSAMLLGEKPTVFNFDYLLHIHKQLFEDIYNFAGKIRVVDMVHPEASVPFAYVEFIKSEAERIFSELRLKYYLVGLDRATFVQEIASLSTELNALHPFREGNGRAIRLFLIMLADHAGYLLDYSQVSSDKLISADKLAYEGDLQPIMAVYEKVTC
jgi:cell filamentation protein